MCIWRVDTLCPQTGTRQPGRFCPERHRCTPPILEIRQQTTQTAAQNAALEHTLAHPCHRPDTLILGRLPQRVAEDQT